MSPPQREPAGRSLRQRRHGLRRAAAKLLPLERVNACGVRRSPYSETVDVYRTGTGAYFCGVETCGSVWHCAVCAGKIAAARAEEVQAAIQAHLAAGGGVYMVTLTLRHSRWDFCNLLRQGVAEAWRSAIKGAPWKRGKEAFGIQHYCRALEVTHGVNGWHPHLHCLLFTRRKLGTAERIGLKAFMFHRWATRVAAGGLGKVSRSAYVFEEITSAAGAGRYVAKWGAGCEVARGSDKAGKSGRSPWQLLEAAEAGDETAARLYRDYARSFKGARHLTWSRGAKAQFGLVELEDAAIAATGEESTELPLEGGEGPKPKEAALLVGRIEREAWREVVKARLTGQVLDQAAASGWLAVCELLERHGIDPTGRGRAKGQPPPDRRYRNAGRHAPGAAEAGAAWAARILEGTTWQDV